MAGIPRKELGDWKAGLMVCKAYCVEHTLLACIVDMVPAFSRMISRGLGRFDATAREAAAPDPLES